MYYSCIVLASHQSINQSINQSICKFIKRSFNKVFDAACHE